METVTLLGVTLHIVTRDEAYRTVLEFFEQKKQHRIFTPNPEMLVAAQKDETFRTILNTGDLNICDGKGIELAVKQKIERIPGADFMLDICTLAEEKRKTVYLLGGGRNGSAAKAEEVLRMQFPNLVIAGYSEGPQIQIVNQELHMEKEENDRLLEQIQKAAPDILFVAFGHKKQEYWIHNFLSKAPSVKIAMGVGGTFDFIAGIQKRAPRWVRKLGFEWFWRLMHEPRRIRRIWNAIIVFPLLVLRKR